MRRLEAIVESGSIEGRDERSRFPEFEDILASVAADARVRSASVLLRHYGGPYFAYEHAAVMDCLSSFARHLGDPVRDVILAAVISAASELVTSVGNQFAQPLRVMDRSGRVKAGAVAAIVNGRGVDAAKVFMAWVDRYSSLPAAAMPWSARTLDYRDALTSMPPGVGVVYADPPYTRDHYSRFYHVLETIALGDEPGVTKVSIRGRTAPTRAVYRLGRHQSPFSIVSQAPVAFEELFALVAERDSSLVLSYSPLSIPTAARGMTRTTSLTDLVATARTRFSRVDVLTAGAVVHSKLNRAALNAPSLDDAEAFVVATNRR